MPTPFVHRVWRDDLIQAILRAGLVVGVPVYAFSVYWGWVQGLHAIIVVDTVVLALVAVIWWFSRWPNMARARNCTIVNGDCAR